MAITHISSILLATLLLAPTLLVAETSELADRTGLESVWKKSGRTTRVIDYPYSPQPGIYGGKDVRQWENKGVLFSNPGIDEFSGKRSARSAARPELSGAVGEDCAEIRMELEDEIARNARLLESKEKIAEELRILNDKADDQSFKISALEFEIEELEKQAETGGATIGTGMGTGEGGLLPGQTATYLVQDGDNLWGIAGKPEIYNDPYRWLLLYHANRDQIFEPDLIYPGMVLLVPHYPGLEQSTHTREAEEPVGEAPPTGKETETGQEE
ncbi:MAG TPA: hypothetical protein ENH12_03355 [Proteobacteria bacterium]|nr:hypothetical protein [Pseudomonadota bacterium]